MTLNQGDSLTQPCSGDYYKASLCKVSGLSSGHLRKLAESALPGEQISRLGWDTLPDGRLLIPYLMPDGSP